MIYYLEPNDLSLNCFCFGDELTELKITLLKQWILFIHVLDPSSPLFCPGYTITMKTAFSFMMLTIMAIMMTSVMSRGVSSRRAYRGKLLLHSVVQSAQNCTIC